MAIRTDYRYHHGGSSNIWSCSDLSLDNKDSQGMNISEMLVQSSISLGRYEHEALSWEKYSAFTNNTLLEEIEKFMESGLVAQKKAYFERHYRKTRSPKALEETAPPEDETCQILHTDHDHNNVQRTERCSDTSLRVRVKHESKTYPERDSKHIKQPVEIDAPLSPSIRRCSDTSLRVRVSRIECRLKKLSPVQKPKWSISSPKSTSSDRRITKDVVIAIEKPKLNALRNSTKEVVDDTKSITPKSSRNASSDPCSSFRQQTEIQCTSSTTSSVLTQSSQSNLKEITTNTNHQRKLSVDKRMSGVVKKSQELSIHHRRSSSGECKSPRPKSMTIKPLYENKSKEAVAPEVAERVNSPRLSKQKKMELGWR
ncbi:TPX2 (targeting protein for Xklp2) protein family [Euphorbia peplus]|nr:TPX2 (targeting protein for Xklp2) protein family [Euphorbia peplus]